MFKATKAEAGKQGDVFLEGLGVVGDRVGMNDGVSSLAGLSATTGLVDPHLPWPEEDLWGPGVSPH